MNQMDYNMENLKLDLVDPNYQINWQNKNNLETQDTQS